MGMCKARDFGSNHQAAGAGDTLCGRGGGGGGGRAQGMLRGLLHHLRSPGGESMLSSSVPSRHVFVEMIGDGSTAWLGWCEHRE
jgi:hypothetical protein